MRFYQAGQFEYDAINDRLPTVSYILPTSYQSEHPDFMPAAGADFVKSKLDAIAANPDVWAKTLFILIYDENDGYFDHVAPPTAPAGTAGEYITSSASAEKSAPGPIGLGFRVPCILISPWTVGGFVCHDTFDHTSVTRLLELVTGVVNPNITAWRRADRRRLHVGARGVPERTVPAAAGHEAAARARGTGSGPVPASALPRSEPDTARPAARVQTGAQHKSRLGRSGGVTNGIARIIEFPSGLGQPARDHSGGGGRRARGGRYGHRARRSALRH